MTRDWLGCSGPHYAVFGSTLPIPCVDGDWLLALLRCSPYLLVCLVDTQIFYQISLMFW